MAPSSVPAWARADQAKVRHVALVLLTFVVLQHLRIALEEKVGGVNERWQLAVSGDSDIQYKEG